MKESAFIIHLCTGTTLGDHDFIRSFDTKLFQESIMRVGAAGKVSFRSELVENVCKAHEACSHRQHTLESICNCVWMDIRGKDVEELILLRDLERIGCRTKRVTLGARWLHGVASRTRRVK